MTKTKRSAVRSRKATRHIARGGRGKLAHVRIARPRVQPENVDMKAVRKALREYFLTHPHALE